MSDVDVDTRAHTLAARSPRSALGQGGVDARRDPSTRRGERKNIVGFLFSILWLVVTLVPIYWIVLTSFKSQADYYSSNPLFPAPGMTLDNYWFVIESDFPQYFLNSVIVVVASVGGAVLLSFLASYAIVRSRARILRFFNGVFLLGLAIPLQAAIIPIYLIIIRLGLYDTLGALILPSVAFAIPLSVLVLSNFIRDVPRELFEAMRVDGASEWKMVWNLAFPLTRPALVTVTVYNALSVWNSFLFPLILTQSPDQRTLPLALWTFQGQYSVNTPAVLASVVLTTLPVLVLYIFGQRQLLGGLTAGFNK